MFWSLSSSMSIFFLLLFIYLFILLPNLQILGKFASQLDISALRQIDIYGSQKEGDIGTQTILEN